MCSQVSCCSDGSILVTCSVCYNHTRIGIPFYTTSMEAFPKARILRVTHSNKTQPTLKCQGRVLMRRRVTYLTTLCDVAGAQSIGTHRRVES